MRPSVKAPDAADLHGVRRCRTFCVPEGQETRAILLRDSELRAPRRLGGFKTAIFRCVARGTQEFFFATPAADGIGVMRRRGQGTDAVCYELVRFDRTAGTGERLEYVDKRFTLVCAGPGSFAPLRAPYGWDNDSSSEESSDDEMDFSMCK